MNKKEIELIRYALIQLLIKSNSEVKDIKALINKLDVIEEEKIEVI